MLAELRNDVALIRVDFGVDMALVRLRRHGLVAAIASRLDYLWLGLF